jgi:hypothetical protein
MSAMKFMLSGFVFGLIMLLYVKEISTISTLLSMMKATLAPAKDVAETWNTIPKSNPSTKFGFRDPNDVGTWIGNNWVPPKQWKLYSAVEMRSYLSKHSILFIGDSQIRRAFATLYEILDNNTTASAHIPVATLDNPNMLAINKNGTSEPCTRWTNHSVIGPIISTCRYVPGTDRTMKRYFDYSCITCYKDLIPLVAKDQETDRSLSREYSLIIIAIGTWEVALIGNQKHCQNEVDKIQEFPLSTYTRLNASLAVLNELASPNTTVVWRTVGYHRYLLNSEVNDACNVQAKTYIDQHRRTSQEQGIASNLTYVDWGKAIMPRSKRKERNRGDNDYHYGLEARYQFFQMLVNTLVEHEEQNLLLW